MTELIYKKKVVLHWLSSTLQSGMTRETEIPWRRKWKLSAKRQTRYLKMCMYCNAEFLN